MNEDLVKDSSAHKMKLPLLKNIAGADVERVQFYMDLCGVRCSECLYNTAAVVLFVSEGKKIKGMC